MQLFARNKQFAVQSFILKVVNNNCSEVTALIEGPRLEGRVNLTVVVRVVPLEKGQAVGDVAFTAVTKEFSTVGVAVVLDRPRGLDEVLLGFRWEGQMNWVRAQAKHLSPMGGGFFQLGFRLTNVVYSGDYPGLDSLGF